MRSALPKLGEVARNGKGGGEHENSRSMLPSKNFPQQTTKVNISIRCASQALGSGCSSAPYRPSWRKNLLTTNDRFNWCCRAASERCDWRLWAEDIGFDTRRRGQCSAPPQVGSEPFLTMTHGSPLPVRQCTPRRGPFWPTPKRTFSKTAKQGDILCGVFSVNERFRPHGWASDIQV